MEFEALLNDVVHSKRLSASKMNKLTEIAMKSLQDDTQLVSILYRTHKSLPSASKVSSLYVFDALARAARAHVVKHTESASSERGNAATFLLKIEGVLDGLFQDMASLDIPGSKDKSNKILDIWAKGNTFSPSVLSRLKDVVNHTEQDLSSKPADPRATTQPQKAPSPQPQPQPQPQAPALTDPQAALLALLTKAVTATPQTNNEPPASAEAAPLSILQQLAQTAKLNNDARSASGPSHPQQQQQSPDASYPRYPRQFDDHHDHSRPRGRGGAFRGGRGRGEGWKDERERPDHHRFKDWSPRQNSARSRSKSPPSRYRRDVKPYSPPRRPSVAQGEKDEFGRDLRPHSPDPPSVSTLGTVETTTTPAVDHPPLSTSIAANTSLSPAAAPSTTVTHASELGLDSFNIASFDFTSPASWESLGNMWQVTNGEVPSTEQLMQFVMSYAAGPQQQQQQQQQWSGTWPADSTNWDSQGSFGTRRRTAYGNQQRHWYDNRQQETEAIILGGGDTEPVHSESHGTMQKVGDKWKFVRDPAVGVT